MSEEAEQNQSEPTRKEYSEALLQSAIERLKARGDSTRRMACMALPAPVFHDLCARLLEGGNTVRGTADWLAGQVEDAPTRSSVERFSDALYEEYRLAQLADRRRAAESYVADATAGDPDAMQMALNTRLTELVTDALMQAGDASEIDTERLEVLAKAARVVAMTAFDKQKMDARIKALEKQIEDRDLTIRLKEKKLESAAAAVEAVQKKAAGKKAITTEDLEEVSKAIFG